MKGYIYRYTFPDGKVYIGQTNRPIAARHKEHINPSSGKVNVGFWSAFQKYGADYPVVLETVEAKNGIELKAKLNHLEAKYIESYHALDPTYGYNRVSGGHAVSASEKVLSRAFDKVFSEVWKERESFYSDLERIVDSAFDKEVQLDEKQMGFLRNEAIPALFPEDARYFVLTDSGLLSCNNLDDGCDDFREEAFESLLSIIVDIKDLEADAVARSVTDYISANAEEYLSEGIIQQIAKDGTVVKEYSSITEIMHELNLSYNTNIYNVLEGKQKTAYGFIWRWKNK